MPAFMSPAPRPYMRPSRTTGSKGGDDHSASRADRHHVDVAVEDQRASPALARPVSADDVVVPVPLPYARRVAGQVRELAVAYREARCLQAHALKQTFHEILGASFLAQQAGEANQRGQQCGQLGFVVCDCREDVGFECGVKGARKVRGVHGVVLRRRCTPDSSAARVPLTA